MDNPFGVKHSDRFDAKRFIHICARDPACSRTDNHNFKIFGFFAAHFKNIDESCCCDNRCSVLVIVEYGYITNLFESLFDLKTSWSADIF